MEAGRAVKRIHDWQPQATRKRGRPKIRWKGDVRENLKDLEEEEEEEEEEGGGGGGGGGSFHFLFLTASRLTDRLIL
jgi:hypothetical protein